MTLNQLVRHIVCGDHQQIVTEMDDPVCYSLPGNRDAAPDEILFRPVRRNALDNLLVHHLRKQR